MNEEILCPRYSGDAIVDGYDAAAHTTKTLSFSSMASAIATAMATAISFPLSVDNKRNNKILRPTSSSSLPHTCAQKKFSENAASPFVMRIPHALRNRWVSTSRPHESSRHAPFPLRSQRRIPVNFVLSSKRFPENTIPMRSRKPDAQGALICKSYRKSSMTLFHAYSPLDR